MERISTLFCVTSKEAIVCYTNIGCVKFAVLHVSYCWTCFHFSSGTFLLDRCNYHGRIYLEGDRFVSHDGCNHCMCTLHGTACTEIACSDVTTTPPPSAVGKRKAFNVYLSPFVFMIATISSVTTINDYL